MDSLTNQFSHESGFDSNQNPESPMGKEADLKADQDVESAELADPVKIMPITQSSKPPQSRSTGPHTVQGKRRSSMNSITHGGFSREIIQTHIRKEDRKEYLRILKGFL